MDSNHETQYIIVKTRGCHSIIKKEKKKKKKKEIRKRKKNKGLSLDRWINSQCMLKNANLPLNSSPFEPIIQSAPCPKQTFPCSEVCTCTTHKSNVLNFIHSPFNFLAQHFQYYFIMLIDHIALDSSYAHY